MTVWMTSLLVLLLVFVTETGTTETCTREQIQTCNEPFTNKYDPEDPTKPYPQRDNETMQQLCSAFDTYQECLEPFRDNCTTSYKNSLEGTEDAYTYICVDGGINDYLAIRECFDNSAVQSKGATCRNEAKAKLNQIDQELRTAAQDQQQTLKLKYCKEIQEGLLDCEQHVIETECSVEAARYQYTVDSKLFHHVMIGLGCDPPRTFNSISNTTPDGTSGVRASAMTSLLFVLSLVGLCRLTS